MYVKCPYCEYEIRRLPFRMIEVEEERFSEEQVRRMREQISLLQKELSEGDGMESSLRVVKKNQIERLENDLQNNLRTYHERVYHCPSCEKLLSVVPSHSIDTIIASVNNLTYDIRNLS